MKNGKKPRKVLAQLAALRCLKLVDKISTALLSESFQKEIKNPPVTEGF